MKLDKVILSILLIVVLTFFNVVTTFCVGAIVCFELLAHGINSQLSLVLSIGSAIVVFVFVLFNHKLRSFVKDQMMNQGVQDE